MCISAPGGQLAASVSLSFVERCQHHRRTQQQEYLRQWKLFGFSVQLLRKSLHPYYLKTTSILFKGNTQ